MNSIDYYLINIICDFLLLLVIQGFFKSFLNANDDRRLYKWITSGCWYIGTILINELFHISVLNLFANILLMFAISFAFYGKIWKKIIITILIAVLSAASDLLAYAIVSPILGEENYFYSFVFTVVIMFMMERALVFSSAKDVVHDIVGRELAVFGIIPVLSIIILYCITASCPVSVYMTIASMAVVGVCVVSFLIYNNLNRNLEMRWKQNQLENQIEAYKHELVVIQESDRKIQNVRHDLKNHLLEMQCLAEAGKDYDIIKYIDEIFRDINFDTRLVHTGKYEIDSLINYLLEDAQNKGIDVSSDITIPEDIDISYYKLNVVLGNLLENAIEAAAVSIEKQIHITMKYDRGMLYLNVINSYAIVPQIEGNKYVSRKQNAKEHGIGLRSVKDIIERQQGTINIVVDEYNRKFNVEVMVYIK